MKDLQRVLVTGGTGFLGTHIARRLLKEGVQPRLVDIAPLNEPDLDETNCEVQQANVLDAKAMHEAVKEVQGVVHTAAALPIRGSREAIMKVNVEGTCNVLQAALEAGVQKVIYISSTAVYGVPKIHPLYEDSPIIPLGDYGESKVAAEGICREYQQKGLDITILRPKTFVGPGRLGIFQILFEWIRDGAYIPIIGNGWNRYQLLAVQDLVDAIWRCLTLPNENGLFNVGSLHLEPVGVYLTRLLNHAGTGAQLVPLPPKPVQLFLRAAELAKLSPLVEWHYKTACQDSFVDVTRLRQAVDWEPQYTDAEILIETYDWYIEHYQEYLGQVGITHRVAWDQKVLKLFKWKTLKARGWL